MLWHAGRGLLAPAGVLFAAGAPLYAVPSIQAANCSQVAARG
jgi:hypothetical protein